MEPRKEVLKKGSQDRKNERKSRFRIVKLEERIAPCIHLNSNGKFVGSDNARHCEPI